MPISGIDHVAVTVADIEATVAFYGRVLGAEVMLLDEWRAGRVPIVLLQVGANRLSVHHVAAPAAPHARVPTPGALDVCFGWNGSIDSAVAHLVSCEVEVIEGPVPRPAADGSRGRSVYFRDPDGNLLELLATDPD